MFVSFMANGADVTLAWDPNSEPNVQGYRLHYGLRSGNYMGSLDVGNVTRSTAALPFGGETYFLSLTAYNTHQLHSDFSNEVSFRPPVKPGAVVNTNQLNLVTDGNGAVEIAWNSSALDRATAVHYIAEPPTHGRIAGAASSLRYEPAPGFPGFDQCRLILVDINENVLKLEITIAPATVAKPINDGPTSFRPVDDAYLRGGRGFNSSTLRVKAGRRISYLKFKVRGLSGSVQSATLRLQEHGNRGKGTLRVYRGSHNNWTESNLSHATAPAESGQVGVYTGRIRTGQVVNIDVTPLVTGNGTYSVILKQDAGANDVWFGSDETTRGPQLNILTTGGSTSSVTLTAIHGDGSDAGGTGQVGDDRSRLGLEWDATSGRWLVGWSGSNWVLQESLQPNSLWTDVPSPVSNPYPILLDGEYRFYRLRAAEEHGMQDGGSAAASEPYSIRSDIESLGEPRRLGRD
jgi:hypothetical protein